MSEGVEYARATFNRHKDAIQDIFVLYSMTAMVCRKGIMFLRSGLWFVLSVKRLTVSVRFL
ncbi:MAG: hypothetical protein MJZ16_12560, partial [Bacteroidales bacterium]|nr:hypothetical protein [Bacteroidales bacterium]